MPIRAAEARVTLREEQAAGKQYLTSTLHEMNKTTLTKLSYFNSSHSFDVATQSIYKSAHPRPPLRNRDSKEI